jgi:hypothetical protein
MSLRILVLLAIIVLGVWLFLVRLLRPKES